MTPHLPRAIEQGLANCHGCARVTPVAARCCPRCGAVLHLRKPASLQRTVALLLAAIALYLPANLLPVMTISELGDVMASTILEGMEEFWRREAYPIAIVIFVASILIPIVKIVALVWLCAAATGRVHPSPRILGRIYWFTELLGRWSMVDIFVVSILVALVQFGAYMTVTPGPGALAFAGVVVLTMFAAMSFDPRLLWDRLEIMKSTENMPPLPDRE
ncbi:MAG: paraquat-inducible protein A [Verrucomicrobia bacterium]|nr:paraquat-inducible protein A [Verrucomicrobiota bacterium]